MQDITLNFNLDGKPITWSMVHNLDEHGLSIESALMNFTARSLTITQKEFMKYVKSKDPQIICKASKNSP